MTVPALAVVGAALAVKVLQVRAVVVTVSRERPAFVKLRALGKD